MVLKTLGPGAIGVKGLSLEGAIGLAREAGFEAVTFDINEAARLAEERGVEAVRGLFDGAGVRPESWGVPVAWRASSGPDYRAEVAALPAYAALGRALGCRRATSGVWPGSDELGWEEHWAFAVARLRPVAAALDGEGCRLGLEFIGPKTFRAPFRHAFVHRLDQTMELAGAIGTGNVGVLLDAWHLHATGGTGADVRGLAAEDVVAVHVNDAPRGVAVDDLIDTERALPGETGVIDLAGFMGGLRAIGYDGPVMAEPFSARLEALAATDPLAAAREAKRSLDGLWELGVRS